MASYKGEDKLPVQGGFLIMKPDVDDYKNIINIMMTTEFRKGDASLSRDQMTMGNSGLNPIINLFFKAKDGITVA
jgi:hypothetical protein